jgi:hypothetical protein
MKTMIITLILAFLGSQAWTQKHALLKFDLEQSIVYRLKSESQQNMSQTMGGMQRNTTVNNTTVVSLKVLEEAEDYMVVEFRFDTIMISTNSAGMSFNINSTDTGDLNSDNIGEVLSVFMNRYCSNPLFAKMTYDGKIKEFINISLFADYIVKDVDSIKSQMASFIKGRAKMMVDAKSVKSSIEAIMAYLPGTKVEVGGSWDQSLDLSSGGMMYLINSHYQLNKIDGDVADIAFESTMDPADSEPVVMDGNTITNHIRGTSKSNMKVDIRSGMLIESTGKYHMEGDLDVEVQGNQMVIPNTIDGETRIYRVL